MFCSHALRCPFSLCALGIQHSTTVLRNTARDLEAVRAVCLRALLYRISKDFGECAEGLWS